MYRKNVKIIISLICAILIVIYCALVFLLPEILNCKKVQSKCTAFIEEKFEYKINYSNLNFNISPLLKLSIDADYLYLDFSKRKLSNKKSSDKKINLNFLKNINIKSADIILNNNNSIKIKNIKALQDKNKTKITLKAQLFSNSLKHTIEAGNDGFLEFSNGKIFAKNFLIELNKNPITLNGLLNKKPDFQIKGQNLSALDIEEAFLFYMKSIKPDKNFIENFYDFKGLIDVDLTVKNKDLRGYAVLKKFEAKFKIFDLPLYFEQAKFDFEGDKITSSANGRFTVYPMKSNFSAENIFSKERIVKGSLSSDIKEGISKYIKDTEVRGEIGLIINYLIQNQTPKVEYIANIKNNSLIKYTNYSTGYIEGSRQIVVNTIKKGNDLEIENYKYIYLKNNSEILSGTGLFSRKDTMSKFNLKYVTCKTNSFIPVDIIGSLSNFVKDGEFRGEIKFDNIRKLLTGNFELQKTNYKNFYVDLASINADGNNIKIKAKGTYEKSPFSAVLDIANDFNKKIIINNLELYLKQYTIRRKSKTGKKTKINSQKIKNTIKTYEFEIKKAYLRLDKLTFKNIILENIELIGAMKDNLVEFSMPEIKFAQGYLGAAGLYDVKYNSSYIDFYAEQINSTLASSMIFGLKEQFRGFANATMHLRTYDKLSDIKAQSSFYIKDGALTKLGSSEFIISKNKKPLKFKLQDIINIDIKKMEALTSDIEGYFDINNEKIENAEIYNENKFLSLYLKGKYNIKNQNTDINLWGRYNKDAQRGIKVLFVPLSWITKFIFKNENTKALHQESISKIPPVQGNPKQEEIVNVSLKGNINDYKNLKINLKAIK